MSVLGHLITNFETREEDLATEALHYVLTESEVAREALVDFINQSGSDLPPNIHFETQTGAEEGGRPDLKGTSKEESILYIESKFWAQLTDNQPEAYLKSLPGATPGVCMFVAPSQRMESLWIELIRLCREDGDLEVGEVEEDLEEFRAVRIGKSHRLALCSWDALLGAIRHRLHSNDEGGLVKDVDQLIELCDRIDTDAFRPFQREDLAPRHGQRILDFYNIMSPLKDRLLEEVGAITERGENEKRASYKGRSRWYYRIAVGGRLARLQVSYKAWSTLRPTPFWVGVRGHESEEKRELKRRLEEPGEHSIEALEFEDWNDYLFIPLHPPTGVEKGAVLDDLFNQVRVVCDRIGA